MPIKPTGYPDSCTTTERQDYEWRLRIAICLLGGRVVALGIALWAFGLLTAFGLPGLTYANDTAQTQVDIRDLKLIALSNRIDTTWGVYCLTKDELAGVRAAAEAWKSLHDSSGLLDAYKQLKGEPYQLQDCMVVKLIAQQK